jgi:hypothetical protein
MIIKLNKEGRPTGYPLLESNFRQLFPNVSFPNILFPSDVHPFGYGMYEFSQQPTPVGRYEKSVEANPIQDADGYWRQQWSIIEQTAEEKQKTDQIKSDEVRSIRNTKLSQSDWTRLDDNGLTSEKKSEWAQYRQQLRDISDQEGFPFEVTWPTPPA